MDEELNANGLLLITALLRLTKLLIHWTFYLMAIISVLLLKIK